MSEQELLKTKIGQVLTGDEFNTLFPILSTNLIKLTNDEENHNGFQFVTGINEDTVEFNPEGECKKGGIYFTDIDDFIYWIGYRYRLKYCRKLKLLPDSKVYIETFGFKADKIILDERVEIKDMGVWEDEAYCSKVVGIYEPALLYIKNKCKKFQLESVSKFRTAIRYIDNPDEEIQLAAVKSDGKAIKYIYKNNKNNINENIKIAAVEQNGRAIKYIENPDKNIQLAAVKQNGFSIKYINLPSKEIELAAIRQNGFSIFSIKKIKLEHLFVCFCYFFKEYIMSNYIYFVLIAYLIFSGL